MFWSGGRDGKDDRVPPNSARVWSKKLPESCLASVLCRVSDAMWRAGGEKGRATMPNYATCLLCLRVT